MLMIDILRNSSQIFLGVLRGVFQGFGCPKGYQDALLAETMVCVLCCLPVLSRERTADCPSCSAQEVGGPSSGWLCAKLCRLGDYS